MTVLPIARAALTGLVVDHLVATLEPAILVGRGMAPPAGGWQDGQPGTGLFKSYCVARTGRATTPASGEPNPIRNNLMSWSVAYRINCFGALESHAGDVADRVAEGISTLSGPLVLREVEWTLQQVIFGGLTDILPNNATDPPYWQTSVDVSLHLSRSQRR